MSNVEPVLPPDEPVTRSKLRETDEFIDWEVTRQLPDGGTSSELVREWKAGTPEHNRYRLQEAALAGRAFFAEKFRTWDTLTTAERGAANKQAMRALANLCALVANVLDQPPE